MGRWVVLQNPNRTGFRELELAYEDTGKGGKCQVRFIRLWDDGRYEIGVKQSAFAPEYQNKVVIDG